MNHLVKQYGIDPARLSTESKEKGEKRANGFIKSDESQS